MKVPRFSLRKPRGFTLIELLVVISIIAMLATIGVAGGQIVIRKARELQAKAVMKSLEIAIKGYKTEYLRMPSSEDTIPNEDNQAYDTADESGRALMNVLLATGDGVTRNPRQIHFWEPPPAKSGGVGYHPDEGLRDPWGKQGYSMILDYGGDGRIANPYAGGSDGEADELTGDVIIYCAGANTIFEEGGSTSGKKSDDVKSWQ
jgi:prepilin-type N-terminal cleavage/methylation domain-containing protein